MTHEEFKDEMKKIDDWKLAEMAHSELSKMCKTGGQSFRMTVPVQTTDTDMIFSEIITRFERTIKVAQT